MSGGAGDYTREDRALEHALLFDFVVHALAMLSTAALLLPALPGGTSASDDARLAYLAAHPWRFRLGWLPWQLCALGNLWMAWAMAGVSWIPRAPAWLVLVLTLAAVVPDQYAQIVWMTRGVELAQLDPVAYLELERALFPLTAGWAATFYTLAALGWTWCFARAGTWSRALSILSVTTWSAMLIAVVSAPWPGGARPSARFVSFANALGFVQLQVWLGLLAERVLRRARPDERFGRLAPWRYPRRGLVGRALDAFANSRLFGALLEPLPELEMRSDIRDVIYVNYLVPRADVEPFVPPGLELQRLGPSGEWALFTFLTYRHGHFGFGILGPLRRLLPSPIQTNWRIHVRDPETGYRGIMFLTNAVTHGFPALAARMTTEGMPMHVLAHAEVSRSADGEVRVTLDPGEGSAPDAEVILRPSEAPVLRGAWAECFGDFRGFLAYCVPQDRAMSSQPLRARVSRQEIDLGIPLEACETMAGTVRSKAARAIVGDAEPICFRVPTVDFRFSLEAHDRRRAA